VAVVFACGIYWFYVIYQASAAMRSYPGASMVRKGGKNMKEPGIDKKQIKDWNFCTINK
jgi:hypothetical protein